MQAFRVFEEHRQTRLSRAGRAPGPYIAWILAAIASPAHTRADDRLPVSGTAAAGSPAERSRS